VNQHLQNILKTIVFLSLGVALLYWAFRGMEMERVLQDLQQAHYQWVAIAIICGILSHLSRAARWRLLIEPMGYQARLSTSFFAVMSGYLMNFIVPRMGEVSRCALLGRSDNIPFDKLVGTVLVERLIDLLMVVVLVSLILAVQFDLLSAWLMDNFQKSQSGNGGGIPSWLLIVAAIAVLGAFVLWVFRDKLSNTALYQKIRSFAEGMIEGLKSVMKLNKPTLFIFHSIFIWVMYFLMSYFVFFALDATAHLGLAAGLTTLFTGTLAIIVPVPGGIGTYHTLVAAGLLLYGIEDGDGKIYATLSHASQMFMIFVIGGSSLMIMALSSRKKSKDEKQPTAENI
jgi:uncharacterized membrane protein YbhN (UPF0104 family)